MSSFFSPTHPQTGIASGSYLGSTPNIFNYPGAGLTNPPGYQNMPLNNLQQQPVVDSRSTVRQLTTLIPEWKGHFDLADVMMTSQEQMLNNISLMISQLHSVYDQFQTTFDFTRSSLSDLNLQQDKLNNDLGERLKHQDLQNMVTIKSRRLCEIVISNPATTDMSSVFRIPNHINVQVSKELYERVRNLKNEIDYIQNEVQLLKEIDVFQAPSFIDSVLNSHDSRITFLGSNLTNLLNRAELALHKDLKPEVWSTLSNEPSTLRKSFLDAIGLEPSKSSESDSSPMTEVKQQIKYLKNFNSSYNDPNFPYLRDYGYNIKDLLTNTVPNQSVFLPGSQLGNQPLFPGSSSVYAQQYNQQQPFGTTPGMYGSTGVGTGLGTGYGTTGTSAFLGSTSNMGTTPSFGSTNALGQNYGQPFGQSYGVSGTGMYGSTSTGLAPTFGSSSNLMPSSSNLTGLGTQPTTSSLNTTGFGPSSSLTGTQFGTSGSGLLGSSSNLQNTGTFGSTMSSTTGTGLFGSSNTVLGTGTGLGGSTVPGTTSFYGGSSLNQPSSTFGTSTTQQGGLFGSGNTGSTSLFGSSSNTQNTGLFGSSNTGTSGFGSTNTGAFGSTNTGGFGSNMQSNTGSLFGSNQSKSTGTELAIYNQQTTSSGFTNFGRT